jgi:nitrate reductase assembly molybdenum cofactor insertion protein NarJ
LTESEYQRLVEFLGRQFEAIDRRFDVVDRRFEAVDERFGEIVEHFEELYPCLERLEQEYHAIVEALPRVETMLLDERGRRKPLVSIQDPSRMS